MRSHDGHVVHVEHRRTGDAPGRAGDQHDPGTTEQHPQPAARVVKFADVVEDQR